MLKEINEFQYNFFGKVHPERCDVSIIPLNFEMKLRDDELNGALKCYILKSQVTATYICKKEVADVFTLKNYVEDSIRVALDALGYTLGCGYDLEIIEMIDSVGNSPTVFGVGIPVIEKAAANDGVLFIDIINLFRDNKSSYLQSCLSDLREAIRVPKDTGFFCYRAIESIKQFFFREKSCKDDKQSWETLRSELNIERADIDYIKQFADNVRHGDTIPIKDDQRAKTFILTWHIVNKFIKYAKSGYRKFELNNDSNQLNIT